MRAHIESTKEKPMKNTAFKLGQKVWVKETDYRWLGKVTMVLTMPGKYMVDDQTGEPVMVDEINLAAEIIKKPAKKKATKKKVAKKVKRGRA